MKIKWAHGRDGFIVGNSTQICNLHFKDEDIRKTLNGIWRLKPSAEPKDVLCDKSSLQKRRVLQRSTEDPIISSGFADELHTNDEGPVSEDQSVIDSVSEYGAVAKEMNENDHSNEVSELKETVQRLQRTVNCLTEKYEQKKFINTLEKDDSLQNTTLGFLASPCY